MGSNARPIIMTASLSIYHFVTNSFAWNNYHMHWYNLHIYPHRSAINTLSPDGKLMEIDTEICNSVSKLTKWLWRVDDKNAGLFYKW